MLAVACPIQLYLVEHFVSIAGARHPTLLPQILEKLLDSHATVLVHHHSDDRLCPWHGPLNDFWCSLAPELAGRYFRSCIDGVENDYVGKSFHTVHVLLCSMRLFWSMLSLDAREIAAGTTFATECRERGIGLGHLAHPAGLVPNDYTFCLENMGYSVLASYFILSAMVAATDYIDSSSGEALESVGACQWGWEVGSQMLYNKSIHTMTGWDFTCGALPGELFPEVYGSRGLHAHLTKQSRHV
jgi:hypothetical protein